MTAAENRLEMKGISKRFGGVVALSNVSLDSAAGEIHAICGENGAGKSTLMKILSGAITDYEGELRLDGELVSFNEPRDAEKAGISIIYQELNLVPELSCAANIFLGREPIVAGLFLDDRQMVRQAKDLFSRLGAHINPTAKVRDLRIGDQQLVEIAKALSLKASILIMDEPTSALTDAEAARLFQVIEALRQQQVTILYISHKMDEVFRLADRITVLRDGRHIRTVPRDQTSPQEVINLMVGREISTLHLDHVAPAQAEVLRVEKLSLPKAGNPGRWQLRDIDLSVRRGEVVGIAGLLGAGRTELLECLFGVSPVPPAGSIFVDGVDVTLRSPVQAMQRGIAFVTEDRKNLGLFDRLTVGENISICDLQQLSRGPFVSNRGESKEVAHSLRRLAIKTDGPHAAITSLSGGNQQKCILARWLLTNPKLLLLDEPTRGIDVGAKAEIYVLLRELCREGLGILMTSSELPELLAVCDRILVLCEGRKTAEFARGEASEENILHAAMQFATARA